MVMGGVSPTPRSGRERVQTFKAAQRGKKEMGTRDLYVWSSHSMPEMRAAKPACQIGSLLAPRPELAQLRQESSRNSSEQSFTVYIAVRVARLIDYAFHF
jgi:hypothetical protein